MGGPDGPTPASEPNPTFAFRSAIAQTHTGRMTILDPARVARMVERANAADLRDALRAVAELQAAARRAEEEATTNAVDAGLSYAAIGRALGVSRQSVRAKHLTRRSTERPLSAIERQAQYLAELDERRRRAAALFDSIRTGATNPQAPT
jgi:hypothetical protein